MGSDNLVYRILLVLFIVFLPKGIVGSIMGAVRPRKAGRLAV